VQSVLPRVGWRKVEISDKQIILKEKGMAITLNAIAQGYAADRVLAVLKSNGIENALVDTGELGAMGRKADGGVWTVGIQHPRVADAYVALARLDNCCMSTSGDYATSFTPDHIYNHIFNPQTGVSPRVFASVTVAAPSGADADALSTAIFVLGLEKGLKLLESMPKAEALFVLKDGPVSATKGFPKA
jgi:thiamine biosynthesis lipoprotein